MARWLLGIIILAIISLLLALFGPFSAKKRSHEMGASIQDALNANGFNSVKVDMSGNVATLTGEVASKDVSEQAYAIARAAQCKTCKKPKHIWHVVDNDLTLAKVAKIETVSPYIFAAQKSEDGDVRLDGYVRNRTEKSLVLTEAERLFPGRVTDNKVRIAAGANNSAWGDVIVNYLNYLTNLKKGQVLLENNDVHITGEAADASVRERVNAFVNAAKFNGLDYAESANISVDKMEAVNVGSVGSASICQTLFNSLKGDTKINFAFDKAEIHGDVSFALLKRLASAANQCESFRVRIEGHTDSDGADDYNQWLSEARANSVVAYLGDSYVDISRLTAIGYGENRPIATNDTPAGKAANRRIEFIITTSE